jgi:hypothetical protein
MYNIKTYLGRLIIAAGMLSAQSQAGIIPIDLNDFLPSILK